MKKIFSILLFLIAISFIGYITFYTLNHRDSSEGVTHHVSKMPEQISSNMTNNNLSEIYSIYLNDKKHKLKYDYTVYFEEKKELASGTFSLYMDGKSLINESVLEEIKARNITDVFQNENVLKYVKLGLDDLKVIKFENKEYLLFKVGYYIDKVVKEKYYLFKDDGTVLIKDLTIRDSSVKYVSSNNDSFYYEDNTLAKYEDNKIYSLEYKKGEIIEYQYYILNENIQKEEINRYKNIKKAK